MFQTLVFNISSKMSPFYEATYTIHDISTVRGPINRQPINIGFSGHFSYLLGYRIDLNNLDDIRRAYCSL